MSLPKMSETKIPAATARTARKAFPNSPWVALRDQLGAIFTNADFAALFSHTGQPALAPWRLALVLVMQFAESLTDRQAADAVRARLDWKYLLALKLDDDGFDHSVLSEFRTRLLNNAPAQLFLERVLSLALERQLLKARGRQRTDATQVLARIRLLNRLELATISFQHALNVLAASAPEWLRANAPEAWGESYGAPLTEWRLPNKESERMRLAAKVGADGHLLLAALWQPTTPELLRRIPAVEALRRIWVQQFGWRDGVLVWREAARDGLPPCTVQIRSPHESEARYAEKRGAGWTGYKVHLTETCDQELPRLITQVTMTAATTNDEQVLPQIQTDLQARDCAPAQHLVDSGYVTAQTLLQSQAREIKLCGPPRPDTSWQGRAGAGFAALDFQFDWEREQAICPAGQQSQSWQTTIDKEGQVVHKIKFSRSACGACVHRPQCTRTVEQRRSLTIQPEAATRALQAARAAGTSPEYAARAGSEGTISQAVRRSGLRRSRYLGEAKTHLQAILTATSINIVRLLNWLVGVPIGKTRRTAFQLLFLPEPVIQ
jgi:transposase